MKTTKTDAFWQSFCDAEGIEGKNYDVVTFGDSPAMANELTALVVHGPKRATAGLLRDYQGEPTNWRGISVTVVLSGKSAMVASLQGCSG